MSLPWLLSSDSHIVEPPDLFTTRIDRRFSAAAPRVERLDGNDFWILDGVPKMHIITPARAGDRFLPERPVRATFDEHVRPGAYEPGAWLADNEADGVWGGVIIPSVSLMLYNLDDTDLVTASLRAYSDWAIEFASFDPARIKALGMVNLDDIPAAVDEIMRLRDAGAAGVLIPVEPPEGRAYDQAEYEPFWSAAEETGLPLNFHVATSRRPGGFKKLPITHFVSEPDHLVRIALADMIYGGVFERHPRLRVVSVEQEGDWAPFFVRRLDWHWIHNTRRPEAGFADFANGALPSDFFKENVYISFFEDDLVVDHRAVLNVDRLMWASDFPHDESTYPRSRQVVDDIFGDVPADERLQMVQTNAQRLYDFEVPAVAPEVAVTAAATT